MNTTRTSSAFDRTTLFSANPPYVVFHTRTPAGRLYHVNGRGFATPHPDEATRHPVSPENPSFRLAGVGGGTQGIYCSAPLHITATAPGQVEVCWGDQHLFLDPENLINQAGRFVWARLRHCYQGGYPFGPVVRVVIDGQKEKVAIFNIKIHSPPGRTGFLHLAPPDWDSTPRSIMTHLGLLGFSSAGPQPADGRNTIWRRSLDGLGGKLELLTGTGSRVHSLNAEIPGHAPCHVGGIGSRFGHRNLHRKLVSLIGALEAPGQSADLLSPLLASLFPNNEPPPHGRRP